MFISYVHSLVTSVFPSSCRLQVRAIDCPFVPYCVRRLVASFKRCMDWTNVLTLCHSIVTAFQRWFVPTFQRSIVTTIVSTFARLTVQRNDEFPDQPNFRNHLHRMSHENGDIGDRVSFKSNAKVCFFHVSWVTHNAVYPHMRSKNVHPEHPWPQIRCEITQSRQTCQILQFNWPLWLLSWVPRVPPLTHFPCKLH